MPRVCDDYEIQLDIILHERLFLINSRVAITQKTRQHKYIFIPLEILVTFVINPSVPIVKLQFNNYMFSRR